MKVLRTYGRPVLVVALVAACVLALVASWSDVTDALPQVGWARFGVSTLLAVLAGISLAVGWRLLLDDMVVFDDELTAPPGADVVKRRLSQHVGLAESVGVYSASQLGKYIPGSVWPVVAQMSLSRRHGITRRSIVAAFVNQLLLLAVTAVVTAAVTLPWGDADQLRSRWWLIALAPLICLVLVPGVQSWLLGVAGRVLHRDLAFPVPSRRGMVRTVGMSVLTYVCFGLHLAVMGWPLMEHPTPGAILQCIGAFALAWAAGFVVIFAPAGLGVRELVLTVTLSSLLAKEDATALAVLSRTSIVLADLVLGLYGLAVIGANRKLSAAQQDQDVGHGLALAGLDVGHEAEHQDEGGDQQQDGRADEAGNSAGVVADVAQDEPAHHQGEPGDAGHDGDPGEERERPVAGVAADDRRHRSADVVE